MISQAGLSMLPIFGTLPSMSKCALRPSTMPRQDYLVPLAKLSRPSCKVAGLAAQPCAASLVFLCTHVAMYEPGLVTKQRP